MITAIDTSVLIAIVKGEPGAAEWIRLLAEARTEGDLIICDVVAAEYFAILLDEQKFQKSLSDLGVVFNPVTLLAAQLAGRVFRAYRRTGGPRKHLVPDFLIGSHARQQAGRIAAIDRGYLRSYFPDLEILKPS